MLWMGGRALLVDPPIDSTEYRDMMRDATLGGDPEALPSFGKNT